MTAPVVAWVLMLICAVSLCAACYCWGWVDGLAARSRWRMRVELSDDTEKFQAAMRRAQGESS